MFSLDHPFSINHHNQGHKGVGDCPSSQVFSPPGTGTHAYSAARAGIITLDLESHQLASLSGFHSNLI